MDRPMTLAMSIAFAAVSIFGGVWLLLYGATIEQVLIEAGLIGAAVIFAFAGEHK